MNRLAIRVAALAALFPLGAASAQEAPSPEPRPAPSIGRLTAVFIGGTLLDCLGSRDKGVWLADMARDPRDPFRPATADERFLYRGKAMPVWATDLFKGHLTLSEPSADRCEIAADQLHVEQAFQWLMRDARGVHPDFVNAQVKANYNPIVHQLERVEDGVRTVIHMEGAEPGGFMHAYRYSLVHVTVIRQPASEWPPFR